MNLELSPLFLQIPLFIVKVYFEFQEYNYVQYWQRYDKMSQFLRDNKNDNAKAIAINQVFSDNR